MSITDGTDGKPFETILVANRGEIALRVVRTCREMGIRTVVVHSTDDSGSAAVRAADEAVQIGPGPPRSSYLYTPMIIEAALRTGAQAIHPGYGFLSEDPDFAEICVDNGLVFIGPRPEVMAELGDKARARILMRDAGLPVVPGSAATVSTPTEVSAIARRIGLPVAFKAVAGGGGRGIAVVRTWDDLLPAFRATRAEARAVFGDDRVYLERFWEQARHIEVQVVADGHGNVVHLGERDCSVQRRHQKLLEESPAPGLSDRTRARLAEAAVRGTTAAGYTGAGTFEFLVDSEEIAFIEVNCRLQVEHPVTEVITGIDLVREQIRVAAGRTLSVPRNGPRRGGAAVECRINVEDPDRDFAPCPGELTEFAPPGGPFVRVDTHGFPGWRISPHYDSLLAKVIVWAPDRDQALARMRRALGEFRISGHGIRTTRELLLDILADPEFRAGEHHTASLRRIRSRTDALEVVDTT